MPKVTLQYDTAEAATLALDAPRMQSALMEYDQWLRGKIKYEDRNELQEARTQLFDVLDSHDLMWWLG